MKIKVLTILIGLSLISSLSLSGIVYAQSPTVVEHQTGDVLLYETVGSHFEDHSNYFEVNDLDQGTLSHYSEEMRSTSNDATGETVITLVNADDLNHLPPEVDPTQDPEFPEGASLFGMQVDSEETVEGTEDFERNEYDIERAGDPNQGWDNFTDFRSFGPETHDRSNFEGGVALGNFSLLPFMGDGNDDINPMDIVYGENFTTWEYMELPIFGDYNWVEMNVTLEFGFYHMNDVTVVDGNDNPVNADVYGVEIEATGMVTNMTVHIPLGDEYDSETPWVPTNATVQISSSRFMEFYVDRDTNNGLFLGFDETESFGISGSLANDSARIYFPEGNANISLYGEFDVTSNKEFSVRNTGFLTGFASAGSNSGLETGDELHYILDEHTQIDFEDKRIINNSPNGDGPDFSNITYDQRGFSGTLDASQEFWASIYIHDTDSIGMIIEQMYTDVTMSGFPEDSPDNNDGSALNQGGENDGPLYFVEIIPLLVGEPESGGIPSNASVEVGIPVEDSRDLAMSEIFRMNEERNDGDDGGPFNFIYDLAHHLDLDLTMPLTSEESSQDLFDITVNGFDYVVVGNDHSYTYEFSYYNDSIPFYFEDSNDAPPARMEVEITMSVTDQRIYDDATGALIFKGDYAYAYVNGTVIADVSSYNVGYDELVVSSTEMEYDFESEMNLVDHSSDYQSAQDPADIPEDPNDTDDEPTDTSTITDTEDTNSTDDEATPELPVPGLILPSSLLAVSFIAIYRRKLRK